ncbi:MAG TPA: M48 family metallopeptidase [Candidatus Paceibacterota bacterium]|jgi:heat shock protein HtpX|nr:M48 family metallopeptidase [Candidatus Paceibacterota bacterium]HPC37392.1 M48 family metallopeptidase [Candidatus Paceibacterota bacterium]HRU35853.1 M48 family metallopeptidase [Candidatus Paceibacterota bacterium]
MANLYTFKSKNIKKTWLLMGLFLVIISALGWFLSYYFNSPSIFYYAMAFSLIMNLVSYFYSDKIVLGLTGAKPVEFKDNPELYRIVENLCITAGLPMPKIYILPELAPNAFATGRNPKNAVIAVTEGLLQKLDTSELEGVIGHELSHIGNRDILLQTIVVVLVGIVTILADIFTRATFWGMRGSRNDNEGGGLLNGILMIIGIIFIILSPLIAQLLQLAISRKREFLADASSALLTRYPDGLARALKKISTDPTPMKKVSNATAHLYIANPFKGKQSKSWLVKIFMTHPPVEERIKALNEMSI